MCFRRPLINVCDRHDKVGELTQYLFSNNMLRYIEGYVQKVNPSKAPKVVGALLDAEASDDFVNNLILSVRSLIPVEQLCYEVRLWAMFFLLVTRHGKIFELEVLGAVSGAHWEAVAKRSHVLNLDLKRRLGSNLDGWSILKCAASNSVNLAQKISTISTNSDQRQSPATLIATSYTPFSSNPKH